MTDLEKKLIAALVPFVDMADAMDDAEDLIHDEDLKGHASISFGGMTMGDWVRDDFRRAQEAFEAYRVATVAAQAIP